MVRFSYVRIAPIATLLGRTDTRQTRPISGTFVQVAGSHMTVIQAPTREPRIMRYELTDFEWAAIKPMLPNKPRGVPRVDDRRILNGRSLA